MGYAENKARSKIITIGETMADQAGAEATDINVIVKKMAATGSMPTSTKQPFYADMSELPNNLRDMLEMGKQVDNHRAQLPKALQHLTTGELINTDPKQLQRMISENDRYNERHAKLPKHFQSLSRQDVLSLTDEQLTNMITPAHPAPKPDVKT